MLKFGLPLTVGTNTVPLMTFWDDPCRASKPDSSDSPGSVKPITADSCPCCMTKAQYWSKPLMSSGKAGQADRRALVLCGHLAHGRGRHSAR